MAAIDKMYVHSYYEYDDLRRWAIAYYPELLFYFYDITITPQQWEENKNEWLSKNKKNVINYNNDDLCGFTFTTNGFLNLYKLQKRAFQNFQESKKK